MNFLKSVLRIFLIEKTLDNDKVYNPDINLDFKYDYILLVQKL